MDAAAELDRLAAGIRVCERCRLCRSRTHAVPGEGPSTAELVFLGEGPGSREDASGRPFVGPAGKLLDRLLRKHGLERGSAFITNCVKCRPPENRTPRRDELSVCIDTWLQRQLDLINPRMLVLLGQVAAQQILGEPVTLAATHGTCREHAGRLCFITYHPAAALRFEIVAEMLDGDFEELAGVLEAMRQPLR